MGPTEGGRKLDGLHRAGKTSEEAGLCSGLRGAIARDRPEPTGYLESCDAAAGGGTGPASGPASACLSSTAGDQSGRCCGGMCWGPTAPPAGSLKGTGPASPTAPPEKSFRGACPAASRAPWGTGVAGAVSRGCTASGDGRPWLLAPLPATNPGPFVFSTPMAPLSLSLSARGCGVAQDGPVLPLQGPVLYLQGPVLYLQAPPIPLHATWVRRVVMALL